MSVKAWFLSWETLTLNSGLPSKAFNCSVSPNTPLLGIEEVSKLIVEDTKALEKVNLCTSLQCYLIIYRIIYRINVFGGCQTDECNAFVLSFRTVELPFSLMVC